MWKYNYDHVTNHNSELYHSDTYLGLDYSNSLKHYKYINRYMKNGKWVYVYDVKENGKTARKEFARTSGKGKYGTFVSKDKNGNKYTIVSKKGNSKVFGNSSTRTTGTLGVKNGKQPINTVETRSDSKLERTVTKATKKVKKISGTAVKATLNAASKASAKGKELLSNITGKNSKTKKVSDKPVRATNVTLVKDTIKKDKGSSAKARRSYAKAAGLDQPKKKKKTSKKSTGPVSRKGRTIAVKSK